MSNKPRKYDWAELPEEAKRLEAQAKSMEPVTLKELEIMNLHQNMKVLDAGCGTGPVTRKIANLIEPGLSVGIDLDPLFIEVAKSLAAKDNIRNIRFELGNIDELVYENSFFDRVYCRLVLMHVNDPVKTVRELARVTEKGGLVSISDNDDGVIMSYPHVPLFHELWDKFGQMSREKGMNRYIGRELFSILSQAGLNSIQIFPFPMYGTQANPAILRALVSVPMQILADSKDDMVENGWFTEAEYGRMVDDVEKALSHPGAFALGMSFFGTGVV